MSSGPTEIRIPVPWGHIAGKTWGDPRSSHPVLAIHGSMDNAATFDLLIPLLPQQCFYVSIDLPGHGQSSYIGPGLPYHFLDFIPVVLRVIGHFGWSKITILSHSYGGFITAFLAAMHPELVTKFVLLDIVAPKDTPPEIIIYILRYIDKKIIESKKFEKSAAPLYSYDEMFKKMKEQRATRICDAGAHALLSQCIIKKGDNKYSFTTDQRLKSKAHPLHDLTQLTEIFSNIKCPVLAIVAEDTRPSLGRVNHLIQTLKTNNRYFQLIFVEGNHDVHLNHPERISPLISKFIYPQSNL